MITIKLDPKDEAKLKSLLEIKAVGEKVIPRALNRTLSGVKTDASAEIRKDLNVKKSAVDQTFRMEKATPSRWTASIESTGAPLALIDFIGTRQTVNGVSVQIKKNHSRKVVSGAFIISAGNHQGVFWRDWHGARKTKKSAIHYGALPRKYRFPMSERFGPRVPDILGNESVMEKVLTKSADRLHKSIEHELNFELSKLK